MEAKSGYIPYTVILIGDAKILENSKSEDVIKVKNTNHIKSLNELEIQTDYVSIK